MVRGHNQIKCPHLTLSPYSQLMGLIVVAAVFVLYQFVTADLQPFIYFQF